MLTFRGIPEIVPEAAKIMRAQIARDSKEIITPEMLVSVLIMIAICFLVAIVFKGGNNNDRDD
jgi:hypothetical protein